MQLHGRGPEHGLGSKLAKPGIAPRPAWEEAEEKVAPVGSHIQAVAPKGVQHIHRGAARTPLGEVRARRTSRDFWMGSARWVLGVDNPEQEPTQRETKA